MFNETIHTYPVNGQIVGNIEQEDICNLTRKRNADNVNSIAFNCGGYALETFNWFLPIKNEGAVAEDAEAKWLTANGFEDNWEYYDNLDYFGEDDELENYKRLKEKEGAEMIVSLLSEIEIPQNVTEEEAKNYALDLYHNHDYHSEIALRIAALNMLKGFPNMREINDWTELNEDEYGIAYRGGTDDFHFVKFDQKNNIYTHKMGWMNIETISNLEEGFSPDYNSRTVYFAKKRNA